MDGENCSFAVATGMVEHECIVYTQLKQERDALRAALSCVVTNLEKGMSRGIQRLQAKALREVLAETKGSH